MKPPVPAFAIWITGLPASGKSTLAACLKRQLEERRITPAVLESDALRQVFTPSATYNQRERDTFYRQVAYIGTLLAEHGVPVIFDATANRRRYRDHARASIPQFFEIYVATPLEVCEQRDPKGIYRQARQGNGTPVPGVQAAYEPPEHPDVVVEGDREPADAAAARIVAKLEAAGLLAPIA